MIRSATASEGDFVPRSYADRGGCDVPARRARASWVSPAAWRAYASREPPDTLRGYRIGSARPDRSFWRLTWADATADGQSRPGRTGCLCQIRTCLAHLPLDRGLPW